MTQGPSGAPLPAASGKAVKHSRTPMAVPGAVAMPFRERMATPLEAAGFGTVLGQVAKGADAKAPANGPDGASERSPRLIATEVQKGGDATENAGAGVLFPMAIWMAMPPTATGTVSTDGGPTAMSRGGAMAEAVDERVLPDERGSGMLLTPVETGECPGLERQRGRLPEARQNSQHALHLNPAHTLARDAQPAAPVYAGELASSLSALMPSGPRPETVSSATPLPTAQPVVQGFDVTQVQRSTDGRVTRLTVTLRPDGLGELAISLRQVDGRLALDIRAEREDIVAGLAADPGELMGAIAEWLPAARSMDVRVSASGGEHAAHAWQGGGATGTRHGLFDDAPDRRAPRPLSDFVPEAFGKDADAIVAVATQARIIL